MNFSELSKYLKAKYSLADDWEVYAFEHLPIESPNPTHVQVSGGSPTGKRGGFSTWENCLDKKDFILSFEEIAQAKAAL